VIKMNQVDTRRDRVVLQLKERLRTQTAELAMAKADVDAIIYTLSGLDPYFLRIFYARRLSLDADCPSDQLFPQR
jgi:hypothetical protein